MNKIDKMIKELCPNGVEHLALNDIVILNGFKQIGASELESLIDDKGDIDLLPSSKNYNWKTTIEKARKFLCFGKVIALGRARHPNIKYCEGYFVSSNNILITSKDENLVLQKYLFYIVDNLKEMFYIDASTYPKFDAYIFKETLIPVPPLEVQNKIVEILDKFTNYEAELEAELEYRNKQYKYYRDSLFSNLKDVEYKTIEEICEIKRGERITKKDLVEDGEYIAISGGVNPFGRINKFNREPNTITVAQYGSAGFVNFQKEKFWANDVVYSIFPNLEIVNNKYLYYCLLNQQEYIYSLTTKALPDHLPIENLKNVEIPIPPLEVQNKVVEILDKFNASVNDISDGIPKEIELRRKQYEYYRNKLLTFKIHN